MESTGQLEFVSNSPADTDRLGHVIAEHLLPSTLVTLQGTLGAGKTRLVQAIAEALRVDRRSVVSPTFTLVQQYTGRLNLIHIDAYRIRDRDEYQELGIDELLETDAVVFIEWADRIADSLPDRQISILIEIEEEDRRRFEIRWPASDAQLDATGRGIRASLAPEESSDACDRLPPFGM